MGERRYVIDIYLGTALLAARFGLARTIARRSYVGRARGYAPGHRMVTA